MPLPTAGVAGADCSGDSEEQNIQLGSRTVRSQRTQRPGGPHQGLGSAGAAGSYSLARGNSLTPCSGEAGDREEGVPVTLV